MNLLQFEDVDTLALKAARLISDMIMSTPSEPLGILLSGGHTPLAVYDKVVQIRPKIGENVYIFFGDERNVPLDSGDSNYRGAEPMLRSIGFPMDRVFRVKTELGLDGAVMDYNRVITQFFAKGGRFPLGFLGLGLDGHTASIFDNVKLDTRYGEFVAGVRIEGGIDRITVTPEFLKRVDRLIFLVTGNAKQKILEQFLEDPLSLSAGKAVKDCRIVEVWVDTEALG